MRLCKKVTAWFSMAVFICGYLIQPVAVYAGSMSNDTARRSALLQDDAGTERPMGESGTFGAGSDELVDEDQDSGEGADEASDGEETFETADGESSGGGPLRREIPLTMEMPLLTPMSRMRSSPR